MKNKKDFCGAIKSCKKIIHNADKSIFVKVEKRENEYYNTEIILLKTTNIGIPDKEIFTLCIRSYPIIKGYRLSYDDYYVLSYGGEDYVPKNWYQNRKIVNLRKTAEQCAIKRHIAYVRE